MSAWPEGWGQTPPLTLAAAPPPGLAASAEQTIGDSGELWAGWDLSEEPSTGAGGARARLSTPDLAARRWPPVARPARGLSVPALVELGGGRALGWAPHPSQAQHGLWSRSEGAAPAPRMEEWTAAPPGRRSGQQRVRGRHGEGRAPRGRQHRCVHSAELPGSSSRLPPAHLGPALPLSESWVLLGGSTCSKAPRAGDLRTPKSTGSGPQTRRAVARRGGGCVSLSPALSPGPGWAVPCRPPGRLCLSGGELGLFPNQAQARPCGRPSG